MDSSSSAIIGIDPNFSSRECRRDIFSILLGAFLIILSSGIIAFYFVDWIASRGSAQILLLLSILDGVGIRIFDSGPKNEIWRYRQTNPKRNRILYDISGIGMILLLISGFIFDQTAGIALLILSFIIGSSIPFLYIGSTTRICKCIQCGRESRWRMVSGNWVCMNCGYRV